MRPPASGPREWDELAENLTWDLKSEQLRGCRDYWAGELPGVHLDFVSSQDGACVVVYEGKALPMNASDVDPADVYGTVYRTVRSFVADSFVAMRSPYAHSGTQHWGSVSDCERMAEKVARKCERNALFAAWLVLRT